MATVSSLPSDACDPGDCASLCRPRRGMQRSACATCPARSRRTWPRVCRGVGDPCSPSLEDATATPLIAARSTHLSLEQPRRHALWSMTTRRFRLRQPRVAKRRWPRPGAANGRSSARGRQGCCKWLARGALTPHAQSGPMPDERERSPSRWGGYPIRADVLRRTLQRARELGLTKWIARLAEALRRSDDGTANVLPQGSPSEERSRASGADPGTDDTACGPPRA
jgi:hypothetical protein